MSEIPNPPMKMMVRADDDEEGGLLRVPQRSDIVLSRDESYAVGSADGSRMLSAATAADAASQGGTSSSIDQPSTHHEPVLPPYHLRSPKVNTSPDVPSIVELPATPLETTSQDVAEELEPKSFFDAISSDDEESCGEHIARTGTRTPERPRLVQTRSSSSRLCQVPRVVKAKTGGSFGSQGEVENSLLLRTFANSRSQRCGFRPSERAMENSQVTRDLDGMQLDPGHTQSSPPVPPKVSGSKGQVGMSLPSTAVTSTRSLQSGEPHWEVRATMPLSSPDPCLLVTPSSIIKVPATHLRLAGLQTLPSPMSGFGSPQGITRYKSLHYGFDGLRSNRIDSNLDSNSDRPVSQLRRAQSAPQVSSRTAAARATFGSSPARNLATKRLRRKEIPLSGIDDGLANDLPSKQRLRWHADQSGPSRSLIREHVVITPYPTRTTTFPEENGSTKSSGGTGGTQETTPSASDERHFKSSLFREHIKLDMNTQQRSATSTSKEVIQLELSVSGHSRMRRLVSIIVEDKATFDDEQLFSRLRAEYHVMIGQLLSLFAARRVEAVNVFHRIEPPESVEEVDFLRGYRVPSTGRGRKTGITFLRPHQLIHRDSMVANTPGMLTDRSEGEGDISTDAINRRDSASRTFRSPSLVAGIPGPPTSRDFHMTDFGVKSKSDLIRVEFSHAYSFRRILAVSWAVLFLSTAGCVFWIIFGRSGRGAQHPHHDLHGNRGHDAKSRVVSGCILGITLLLIGSLLEGLWLWLSGFSL